MWKKALLVLLFTATIFELVFTLASFIAPSWVLKQFELPANSDMLFLSFILGLTFSLITVVCAYAFYLVKNNHPTGHGLAYILGAWWFLIGIIIFLVYKKTDSLIMDSFKGFLILLCTYKSCPFCRE